MARSKKHRRHEKHPWPEAEVDESPFARVTADMVTRGRFSFASPQADDELQKSRFLASTAGLLVFKGEAAPSSLDMPARRSALADAIAAHRLAEEETRRLRDELAALRATFAERESTLAQAAQANETDADRREQTGQALENMRAQAEAAREEADVQMQGLRDELTALRSTLAERETALARAAQANETDADRREQTTQAIEAMRAQADAAREEADAQLRSLHDELAAVRSTLADRESALAQATLDHEQARAKWEQTSRDSLSNTEREWKDAEAARLAEAEAKWGEESQRSLAELRTHADAARDQAEKDANALRDNIAALRSIITDREAALAQSVSDQNQARAGWQQESHAALSNAEQAWKTAEAARFAEAERKWSEHSAHAVEGVRAEADNARESADGTIRGLQDQMSAIQATLTEREAALAEAALETQRTREHARKDLDAVLEKMKAWQAEEAQRLAAAEAKWKQQSSAALAEAQSRYQAAEGALVALRLEADRARSNATGGSISPPKSSGDRSAFGTKAVAREAAPASIRLPTREPRGQAKQEQIVLQPHRVLEDSHAPKKRGIGRDLLVVAVLAVVAIVAYPRVEPLIPEPWRSNIAALTGGFGSPRSAPAQGSAVVTRDVNLRVGPSTSASIISTLAQGQSVAMVARRDDWTFVEVAADSRSPQPRRGWVFSSFLRDETADVAEDDSDTTETEGSE